MRIWDSLPLIRPHHYEREGTWKKLWERVENILAGDDLLTDKERVRSLAELEQAGMLDEWQTSLLNSCHQQTYDDRELTPKQRIAVDRIVGPYGG